LYVGDEGGEYKDEVGTGRLGRAKGESKASLNAGWSRDEEGGMGGIRKSDQARQEGSGMLMFAAPSIIRDEGRNVYAGNRA
jgi:hypothetical protein